MRGALREPRYAVAVGTCCVVAGLLFWAVSEGLGPVRAFLAGLLGGMGLSLAAVGFIRDAQERRWASRSGD